MHQSQELACRRCRYMGHISSNTDVCDGFCDDPNVIAIRSPKNALCNYYICNINIFGQTFKSAEHAFQWSFCEHVNMSELAQEIIKSPTPEQAKEVASRVPAEQSGTWHEIKCDIMEQILEAKVTSCPEFKQSLINSLGKRLVEAVNSDIFWSSGLTPGEATTTKPSYYPGLNRLGFILERIRSKLLSRHTTRKINEHIIMHDDETTESSVTLTDGSVPSNANPMLSVSSCSLTQPREATPSSLYLPTQTITPQPSTESSTISAPKLIDTETTSYSIESNVSSSSSLASNIPPVESTTKTVPNNIHCTPSSSKMDPTGTSSDTVQTPHKAMS